MLHHEARMPMTSPRPKKLILVELNEITWRFVDPLIKEGALPNFATLIRQGTRGTPIADEQGADLDPWVSWTTVYTGRKAADHGVRFLEQPPETVKGPRIWDIVADLGRPVGVFGSIMSWPPRRDVTGYWVPGTFSPGPETFPAELGPIQQLNLTYTRDHSPVPGQARQRIGKFTLVRKLRGLGLRVATLARIAAFFVRGALGSAKAWEKVSMQPLINFDFFQKLWKRHQPHFATFHTNHVAHYQHRFWRSADPAPFLVPPSAREVSDFGGAIRFGYQVADELLGRVMAMVDDDTVVLVASGLSQQPYVTDEFPDGRSVLRIRDIDQVVDLLGAAGHCRAYAVMATQWNLDFDDAQSLQAASRAIAGATVGAQAHELFAHTIVGNTISINIRQKLPRPIDGDADCVFPATGRSVKMRELCAEQDATTKQGYHDRPGVLIVAGPGIAAGLDIGECSTLDLAPTMLSVLGIEAPGYMTGAVLQRIFSDRDTPATLGQAVERKEALHEPA
jgi:predicted AlkP superfamily phosphohydrolase/phosphomutase